MSRIYDNWERLVNATLLREELRRLGREDSISSFSSSSSSEFSWSFRGSNSPLLNPSSNIGISFSYEQISQATDLFSDQNFIKRGHSGDLFTGFFPGLSGPVVVKRIRFQVASSQAFFSELEFFSRISHSRLVPLLGHCLEAEKEKFLVYSYLEKRDLSNSLFSKSDSSPDSLTSLDWITRLKIARGVAEGLSYLHHECNPPLVHGDVQASSIFLDHNFEVRLGSLSRISAQENKSSIKDDKVRFTWIFRKGTSGGPKETCAYDVYCFGKVLLELVTGNLGISCSTDATTKKKLEELLAYINIYEKEPMTKIMDPSLFLDEDLLEEVWAMAIVARACLNPNPTRRPPMRYILKALENPLKVVREG